MGKLPGIGIDGQLSPSMQALVTSLRSTNTHNNKVSYWNWNYAPQTTDGVPQVLTEDFVFMPEVWGMQPAVPTYVRPANQSHFLDGNGHISPALMSDLFLGANEPDIYGSCMGDMFGACTSPCTSATTDCPVAHLKGKVQQQANSQGQCNCYSDSHATGCGFWSLSGCKSSQPLPTLFTDGDTECVSSVMSYWRQTAKTAVEKGYKYLVAPLIAANTNWQEAFVEEACRTCQDMSCGCPTHVGWHFYASDCNPDHAGYALYQAKLDATKALMEKFPHLQGAIVNEVGMLNCAMDTAYDICVPNGPNQKYPANKQPNNTCPETDILPNGLGTFVEQILDMTGQSRTSDGRRVVVSFTWFSQNQDGGTYNLELFNDDGTLNNLGKSYMSSCEAWAALPN